MFKLLEYLKTVTDNRQEKKVRHKIGDIIALVFFAALANVNEWVAVEIFGKEHEEFSSCTVGKLKQALSHA